MKKLSLNSCKTILGIIYSKQVDIGPYILNCANYEEYIYESCHLNKRFILTENEFKILKEFFVYD